MAATTATTTPWPSSRSRSSARCGAGPTRRSSGTAAGPRRLRPLRQGRRRVAGREEAAQARGEGRRRRRRRRRGRAARAAGHGRRRPRLVRGVRGLRRGPGAEPAGLDDLRTSPRRQLRKKRRGGRFSRATPVDVCAALAARDEAREGRLERAAFDRALARAPLGLKLERGQAAALTRKFRLGDDGVDYVAFAKWLGPDAAGPAAWAFGDKDQRALRRRLRVDQDAKDGAFGDAIGVDALRRAEARVGKAVELVRAKLGRTGPSPRRPCGRRCGARSTTTATAASRARGAAGRAPALRRAAGAGRGERAARQVRRGRRGRRRHGPLRPGPVRPAGRAATRGGRAAAAAAAATATSNATPTPTTGGAAAATSSGASGGPSGGEDPARWADAVADAFRDMDANGDGEVDGDELAAWLAKRLGVDLSAGDRRTLVDCLDVDASGTISHDEFLDFAVEPPAGREIGQVARRLRKALGEDGLLSLRA